MDEFDQMGVPDEFDKMGTAAPAPAAPKEEPGALSQVGEYLADPTTTGGSAMRGLHQGASYGLGDELQGAVGAVKEGALMAGRALGVSPPLDEEENVFAGQHPVVGEGIGERLMSAYRQERDAGRDEYEKASQAHPKLNAASTLAGALVAPGPKGAGGKGALARMGQMAKFGAKAGAAAGAGGSEADLTKGEVLPLLADTATGLTLGAGGGALFGLASAKLEPYLRKLAEKASFRSLNPRVAMGKGDKLAELAAQSPKEDPLAAARALGRKALDEGITVPFGTSEGAARRAGSKLSEAGEMQGAFLQSVADQHPGARISMPAWASVLERKADEAAQSPAKQAYAAYLRNQAKAIRNAAVNRLNQQRGKLGEKLPEDVIPADYLTIPEAEAEKRALQEAVRKSSKQYNAKGDKLDAMRDSASAARQAVENAVERFAGPEDLAQFNALKKRTGDLAKLNDIASYGANRELRLDGGRLSEQADAIGRRSGHHETPTSWAWNHAKDALGHAWQERRPATLATVEDWLSKRNLSEVPTKSALAEYLRLLQEKDTP